MTACSLDPSISDKQYFVVSKLSRWLLSRGNGGRSLAEFAGFVLKQMYSEHVEIKAHPFLQLWRNTLQMLETRPIEGLAVIQHAAGAYVWVSESRLDNAYHSPPHATRNVQTTTR